MKIELTIDADIEYEFESACEITTSEGIEHIPAILTIYSVKCNGIELISLLTNDELEAMQETLLKERY